jgi:hypothetical protein
VIYQLSRGHGERVEFAERMGLQEFQVSLLTALPLRDALEVVDVPADECGERRCALLDANERRGVFQRYFPMFCLGQGRRTVRCAVRLLPSSYRCHGDL